MSPVLAIYGKEDILGYVRGTLEDEEEKQDIESLVESDPRAAKVVCKLTDMRFDDRWTFEESAQQRLDKLRRIVKESNILT